jgi:surface protein
MAFSIRTAAIAAMLAAAPTLAAANTFVVPLGSAITNDGMTDYRSCEVTPIGETCTATVDGTAEDLLVVDNGSIHTAVHGGVEVDGVTYAPGLPNGLYTGNVTSMSSLFYEERDFNVDIGHWDTSSVTNMSWMFARADSFNQDIGGWDVSSVETMRAMFYRARSFDQDIGEWDVSSVEGMRSVFNDADAFNQDISGWDVSNVTNMVRMFMNIDDFNWNISSWDTSSVTTMFNMFRGADAFNQDISGWCVSEIDERPDRFGNPSDLSPEWGTCPE